VNSGSVLPDPELRISYLADRPDFIPALACGTMVQWREVWPERSLDWRIARFQAHLNRKSLPIAWVAHEDDTVFGTASLRTADIDGFENLTPWLGGVFVFPQHRGRGVGAALCRTVEREAARRGASNLYLGTFDNLEWYRSMGWRSIEQLTLQGRGCHLMAKSIG